jgi:hypothetical protein
VVRYAKSVEEDDRVEESSKYRTGSVIGHVVEGLEAHRIAVEGYEGDLL